MAVVTDVENCEQNPLGTWFEGCSITMKEIIKFFLLNPRADIDADSVLDATAIALLIKKGYLIPLNDVLSTPEAGAKTNYQTLPNKRKLVVSQGLYEYMPDFEANVCFVKALHSLSKKKWGLLPVDAEGRLWFDKKGTKLKGFDLNTMNPENETTNDGGSKIAMVTLNMQLSQDGTKGFNTRRSFKIDNANETYFSDILGVQDVIISATVLAHATLTVQVLAGCDGSTPVLGLGDANFRVLNATTGAPIAVTVTDNNDGTYSLAGATAGDRTIQLYDSVINSAVADIEETQFFQSNVLAVTLT